MRSCYKNGKILFSDWLAYVASASVWFRSKERRRNDEERDFQCWPREKWNESQKAVFDLDYKTVRIFAYSSTREQSNKRSGTRLKTESETGERHEARAVRAHKSLTPRVTDFFTDFEEKTDCFAVYL